MILYKLESEVNIVNIGDRIKKIRKEFDLTQTEFASRIGSVQNTIARYEMNNRTPSASVIVLICKEFNVNEEWLRTGNGEMFLPRSRNQTITDFAENLINEPDSFKKRLFEGLAALDEKDWEYLEKITMKLSIKEEAQETTASLEAAYEQALGIVPKTNLSASSTINEKEGKVKEA